ncbi:MAG TPA: metallophosphoesterase family protein [Acidimicrobiales bacterium]|nr:metallophosphoesterase family protein [Acidimicrobiales bacterium]
MTVRAVVLADTHLRPGAGGGGLLGRLPEPARQALTRADVVLHAGDIVTAHLLHELSAIAPVLAVRGNNDGDPSLSHVPEVRLEVLAGVRVGMIHGSGARAGREARLRRLFPDAGVVVFGHSHIPWNAEGLDGQLLFNPGSPTQRRAQPHQTIGVLDLDEGRVLSHEIVIVGP